ncbi:MAG: hypothetical protein GQ538_11970 [Xanthomonadales bacterium]|nr:hypothetical protein [Xanthomonadales bacterium]
MMKNWDSSAFESEMLPFPCYEFVQLLEGEITITEEDGTVSVFEVSDFIQTTLPIRK